MNKKLKTTVLAAFVCLSLTIYVQPPQGSGQGRGQGGVQGRGGRQAMTEEQIIERSNKLADTLGCNADQKAKLQEIDVKFFKDMQAMRQSGGGDREVMRAKMQSLNAEREKKYKEVLTDAQMKKYIEFKEARMKQRQERAQQRQSQSGQQKPASEERPPRGRN